MLKRILIIDDECEQPQFKQAIKEEFENSGVHYVLCSTKDCGIAMINTKILFDCIVLDWYLEDNNSSLSKLVLSELKRNYFAPVLIYSNHAEDFRRELDGDAFDYPRNLIKEVDKNSFSDIKAKTEEWINENYTARLANIYLAKVYDSIHKTFLDLIDIPSGDIGMVLKKVVKVGDTIDWSNDFILGRLNQELINDNDFRDKLSELINQIGEVDATEIEKKKIVQKILYSNNNSNCISNGDLVKISISGVTTTHFYGIIINPECDLVQGNSRYLEVIKLKMIGELGLNNSEISTLKKNNHESYFYLPSLDKDVSNDTYLDMAAVFKSKHIVLSSKTEGVTKYPRVSSRLQFDDAFTHEGNISTIEYISTLINPYKSEFFTKKNSHDSRVGIPNVYDYLLRS